MRNGIMSKNKWWFPLVTLLFRYCNNYTLPTYYLLYNQLCFIHWFRRDPFKNPVFLYIVPRNWRLSIYGCKQNGASCYLPFTYETNECDRKPLFTLDSNSNGLARFSTNSKREWIRTNNSTLSTHSMLLW